MFKAAIFTIFITLMLIPTGFHLQNNTYHGTLLIGYSGNPENLKSFLSSNGISYYNIGNYFLINDSLLFSQIPYKISKDIFFLKNGIRVSNFIQYSKDPYTINEIISAYGISKLNSYGKNFTGIVLVPYGDPQILKNLDTFDSMYNIKKANISVIYFPSTPQNFPSSWISETDLDVEIMHAVAPDANIILFATANDNSTTLEMALKYIVDNHLGDVVSMSWGGPENQIYDEFFHNTIKEAAEKGITLIASSGDSKIVEYPSSDPYVISVGGTSLVISNNQYSYETIWNESGGGISTIFPKPIWQIGYGLNNFTGRAVPDISLDANPSTGVFIYSNGLVGIGGTSLSSPLFAGMVLDLDSIKGYSLGFFTPQLYYFYENYNGYFHKILINNSFANSWEVGVGLGSPIIYNWNFPRIAFGSSVFLGNYTDVKNIQFYIRGIRSYPFHSDETFLFYVGFLGKTNVSIGYKIPEGKFFYSIGNETEYFGNIENNILYKIRIFIENSTILINGNVYKVQYLPKNFSLYSISKVIGNESYYTNLGPVEFRNFVVTSDQGVLTPKKIVSEPINNGIYGAYEIPFIYNDFIIGMVNNLSENILWPRNFSYTTFYDFVFDNNSLSKLPWIVGTGSINDPYIISGLELHGKIALKIEIKGYIVLKNLKISGIYGIVTNPGSSIILINSTIISVLGIQSMFCNIKIENTTFITLFSISSIFSDLSLKNSTFYSLIAFSPIFDFFSMENTWIISLVPFLTNYFIGIPNIIEILFGILIFILLLTTRKKDKF
ncbi:MAG: S53 family peptidase [Thermoplasmata archaeon]